MLSSTVEGGVSRGYEASIARSSPRTRCKRWNSHPTEETPMQHQKYDAPQNSAKERSEKGIPRFAYSEDSAAARKDSEKMSSSYNETEQELAMFDSSHMLPEQSVAPAARAPPQDAPVKASSHKPFQTPSTKAATGIPIETVYSEEGEHRHSPIQSPPFVMSSSSQKRNRAGKEGGPFRRMDRRKKAPSRERQPSDMQTPSFPKYERESHTTHEATKLPKASVESLEQENRALRAQVQSLMEAMDSGKMDLGSSVAEYESETPSAHHVNLEGLERNQNRCSGGRYSEQYARRLNRATQYSPGTKFVTEFCELLELDIGHHTLLANIMDEHYFGVTRLEPEDSDMCDEGISRLR